MLRIWWLWWLGWFKGDVGRVVVCGDCRVVVCGDCRVRWCVGWWWWYVNDKSLFEVDRDGAQTATCHGQPDGSLKSLNFLQLSWWLCDACRISLCMAWE